MAILASSVVDWGALGKILLVGLVGGAGVVIVFGFLLAGVKYARTSTTETGRVTGYALAGLCGGACIAVAVIGIYAMTQKPSPKKSSTKKSALVIPAAPRRTG